MPCDCLRKNEKTLGGGREGGNFILSLIFYLQEFAGKKFTHLEGVRISQFYDVSAGPHFYLRNSSLKSTLTV